jgi:hypothetical protein
MASTTFSPEARVRRKVLFLGVPVPGIPGAEFGQPFVHLARLDTISWRFWANAGVRPRDQARWTGEK